MPKKLDSCLRKVRRKSPNVNAYAVCSKSTGYVRKKGGGWRKKKRSG